MKTVKQIADEMGISKQAVFKKIDNLGLRQRLTKNNNQWLIDENLENIIKTSISPTDKTSTGSSTKTSTVDRLVDVLKAELNAKNEQIATLQKLLDQEQQLRMVTEHKLLLLEENQKEEEQNQQPEEEEKKTFWKRLWNR